MTAGWAMSPRYGSVYLGPAQQDVYRVILGMTEDGRRPQLTLRELAALACRPLSSVQAAVSRLTALGLIGSWAMLGRHGGTRLWRPSSIRRRLAVKLDALRHRVAVARILARWPTLTVAAESVGPDPAAGPPHDTPSARRPEPTRSCGGSDGCAPDIAGLCRCACHDPARPGESFRDMIERLSGQRMGAWLDERRHDGSPKR